MYLHNYIYIALIGKCDTAILHTFSYVVAILYICIDSYI